MKKKIYLVLTILLIAFTAIYYYAAFPAINMHYPAFWGAVFVLCLLLGCIFAIRQIKEMILAKKSAGQYEKKNFSLFSKLFFGLSVVVVIVFIIGNLAGSTFFRAKTYASLLSVKKCDFAKDILKITKKLRKFSVGKCAECKVRFRDTGPQAFAANRGFGTYPSFRQ